MMEKERNITGPAPILAPILPTKKKAKKKAKPKRKAPTMSNWVPIGQFPSALDFDEAAGRYVDSMSKVELQQETHSKRIRLVVISG